MSSYRLIESSLCGYVIAIYGSRLAGSTEFLHKGIADRRHRYDIVVGLEHSFHPFLRI